MYDFFLRIAIGLALYEASRNAVPEKVPDARIEVKKTQISFFNRRMFAAVSFAPGCGRAYDFALAAPVPAFLAGFMGRDSGRSRPAPFPAAAGRYDGVYVPDSAAALVHGYRADLSLSKQNRPGCLLYFEHFRRQIFRRHFG